MTGFIGEPSGQFQSAENSAMLEKGPFTRNLHGEFYIIRYVNRKKDGMVCIDYVYCTDLDGE